MNTKPNPKNVILDDRNGAVAILVTQLTDAMRKELDKATRTCLNCEHFDEPAEGCRKFGGARPPARIIALGCEHHEDEIPF